MQYLQATLICVLSLSLFGMMGCGASNRYREAHVIENLTIVFVDQETLHQEWKTRTGRDGIQVMPSYGEAVPSIKVLRGYYDFGTNTLYCPKWDYVVCGHELHHAALGHFHP